MAGQIGRVAYSKPGQTLQYAGKEFCSLKVDKGELLRDRIGRQVLDPDPKHGRDRLYGTGGQEIEEEVRNEYWLTIRESPKRWAAARPNPLRQTPNPYFSFGAVAFSPALPKIETSFSSLPAPIIEPTILPFGSMMYIVGIPGTL